MDGQLPSPSLKALQKSRKMSANEESHSASSQDASGAINDHWYNRIMVLASIKLRRRLGPRQGSVLFLNKSLCVKYGSLRHLPEASTMQFIAQNTSIPVPKIRCAFVRKGRTYIVMDRVKGEFIGRGWGLRTEDSKAAILQQLKEMIKGMRELKPPSPAVANCIGGRLWDCRLPGKTMHFGPFNDITQFHEHLRSGLKETSERLPASVNELITLHDRSWPDPVFTHGDLSSLNIMAEGDVITGIVDWETAGWYPHYWEYTTACYVNPRNLFWREEIDKFLEPLPEEQRMEELRRIYFGDVT